MYKCKRIRISVYQQLFRRLDTQAITIFIVSTPNNTDGYKSNPFKKLCSEFDPEAIPGLKFKVVTSIKSCFSAENLQI